MRLPLICVNSSRPIRRAGVWSGARDVNPGPHGPELGGLPSRNSENDPFQFESSSARTSPVQIWGVLSPDYYMKYYIGGICAATG